MLCKQEMFYIKIGVGVYYGVVILTLITTIQGRCAMKVVICDDEQYWRTTIKKSILNWAAFRRIKVCYVRFLLPDELPNYLIDHKDVDVVFLDIKLGEKVIDGMNLARSLRKAGNTIPIIFVTVESHQAANGYLVEAIGFLLKPIDENRLSLFLDRIIKQKRKNKTIKIISDRHMMHIYQKDIVYMDIINHTITYHTLEGDFNNRGTLAEVLRILDKEYFVQIHRSYVIALDKIDNIKATYPYYVNLKTNNELISLPVSRKYIKTLFELYSDNILEKMI